MYVCMTVQHVYMSYFTCMCIYILYSLSVCKVALLEEAYSNFIKQCEHVRHMMEHIVRAMLINHVYNNIRTCYYG